ncbi:cation channel sperm-associated auxiliary subunit delta [Sorex fumeus]|uniref:cation channel sperm-associated auxiliary subunit delta n=1 Tax=Sorex fumeus TaxID=62283 RepID=UPI0024AE2516|nr:cation channel sperm-associated auxiliary subunit delta [Sorex fumeus]
MGRGQCAFTPFPQVRTLRREHRLRMRRPSRGPRGRRPLKASVLQRIPGKMLLLALLVAAAQASLPTPLLIKHPCDENIVLYLGNRVFFSTNNFESSLFPLRIPISFKVDRAEVTAAHFTRSMLLLVVNFHVYIYDYKVDFWLTPEGIAHPVSHVSGDNCCYSSEPVCLAVSRTVFAYLHGAQVSDATLYISVTEGLSFRPYSYRRQEEFHGYLGGIFNFYSLSQVGLLFYYNRRAKFSYSEHPLNRSFGQSFDYRHNPNILIPPGQKGTLIFWSKRSLFISRNTGQLVRPVYLEEAYHSPLKTMSDLNLTIHSVAANQNEMAMLTKQNNLYYGFQGILSTTLMKLPDPYYFSPMSVVTFSGLGKLEILTPIQDTILFIFNYEKLLFNMKTLLMDPHYRIGPCKVEFLEGEFENRMYTIDMNSKLELTATIVPRPLASPMPLVLVSNPHSLGLETKMYEDSYFLDQSTKFRLHISLKQQQHSGRADPNFTSWIKRETASTVTLDIANKEASCVNIPPLTALINIGCDAEKKVVIQKDTTSCSEGILDSVELQNNYSYVLDRDIYSPNLSGEDQVVFYDYALLGCPLLVYYDTPWKPVLQLWQGQEFQEVVEAEYVIKEVYGLLTYSYSLTAETAGCTAQPQNWSSQGELESKESLSRWGRENYQSCHDSNNPNPLKWPDVQYEVLGGQTDNKVVFEQRNGIYVFYLSVVDPLYSYCQLNALFSVHVYGALPPSGDSLDVPIIVVMFSMLGSVWLSYMISGIKVRALGRKIFRKDSDPNSNF